VICPVCSFDNIEGEDNCDNCGSDLRTSDVPQLAQTFSGRLLGEHLDALAAGRPAFVDTGTPVAAAIERMHADATDCVLVDDGGRLVGIFTERDAALKLAGRSLEGITVGAVMTKDPVVLRRTDTVAVAINKMAVGGFRHIPIVDGGRAFGVVAARDVFRHIVSVIDDPG